MTVVFSMRHLKSTVHPDIEHLDDKIIFQRNAARAIVLDGEDVLLLYTERYHDYTLPGGGIDDGENAKEAFGKLTSYQEVSYPFKDQAFYNEFVIELTETVLVSDIKRATTIMQNIRDMGCMLAIDDFGTGYSSLSYLKSLPADYIKIDRSFVANIASSADDRNIVHSTISMVRNMGMQVVAEGIETSEQYELLCHFDCNLGQGYLISRPIPEVNIWDVLSEKVEFGFWKESA